MERVVERVTLFAEGRGEAVNLPPEEALTRARRAHGWVWIEVVAPSREGWKELAKKLGLHHLAVENMLDSHQRPRLEHFGEHAFMALRPAAYDDAAESVTLHEIDAYLGHDFLVTNRLPDTPAPDAARNRVLASPALTSLGPRGAGYTLLDDVVEGYRPVVDGLATDMDEIDEDLFSRSESDVATRIYKLSREVARLQRAVDPLESVLISSRKALSQDDPSLLLDQPEPNEHAKRRALLDALLRDVLNHVQRMGSRAAELHTTLTNALSLAMTLASERATEIGLQQNEQTKKISAWAAILASPAVLAGIWGMNFHYMPEPSQVWGYPAALAVIIGCCGGLYWIFKKRGWL